jgi:hypothetical protein
MHELQFLPHALLDLVDWAASHLDMLSNLKFQVGVFLSQDIFSLA